MRIISGKIRQYLTTNKKFYLSSHDDKPIKKLISYRSILYRLISNPGGTALLAFSKSLPKPKWILA